MKRSALMIHNGYCRSRKRPGGVSSIFSIRQAVKAYLIPCSSDLETLITSPLLSCVCEGADDGASTFLCSCFRTANVCGNGGAPLSPVRHRGAVSNVFHFWPGRPKLRTFCVHPITPISKPNFQLRRAQCCDFCSDLRIGSCTDVTNVVKCASPRALQLRH